MQQFSSANLTLAVLRHLADGAFHSGSDIAAALALSRARIWQVIEGCAALGVEVFRVPGRGYRLAAPISLLAAPTIVACAKNAGWRISVHDAADSTNSELARAAQNRDIHGEALAVELQTAGRGRLGRSWKSPFACSLTFSLGWRFAQGVGALSGLSLAVGLAVTTALERLGAHGIKLKWPNDLVLDGRKLGGILIEVQGDALGPSTAIVGVGLNVRDAARIAQELDLPVADLGDARLVELDRNHLLAAVLDELATMLDRFARDGFKPFREEWNRRDAYRAARVRLLRTGAAAVEGTAQGVDAEGALVLQTAGGRARFLSGELSLRAAARRASSAGSARARPLEN